MIILNSNKIRPLEKLIGKPVLVGENQNAIVWIQSRWAQGSRIRGYGIQSILILTFKQKYFYNKPLKELIKNPNKLTVDELRGRKTVDKP